MARTVIGDLLGDVFGGAELRLAKIDRAVTNATDSIEERIWRLAGRGLMVAATILRLLALLAAVRDGKGVGTLLVAAFIPLTVFRAVAKQHRRNRSRVTWFFQGLCLAGDIGVLIAAYLIGGEWGVVVLAGSGEIVAWAGRRADERGDDIQEAKVRRLLRREVLGRR